MRIRQLVRGTVPWESLEAVARELGARYDQDTVRVVFLDADNWLSTPCVVNDRWFVKVISEQNALVHAVFTGARNLGMFSSGTEGFFERFDGPVAMAEHERDATRDLRALGVNAPRPIEAFEVDGFGVLVLDYLPAFTPLDEVPAADVAAHAPAVFEALSTMHANGVAHGDLRAENVLVSDGDLYFIDATNVDTDAIADARAYDLACALAALEPLIDAQTVVRIARESYTVDEAAADVSTTMDALLRAQDFLGFVQLRPDHDFDTAALTGHIGMAATNAQRGL
ncbi:MULTISPECIES: RIO1 family regulatory kinase/ATPase [Halobacterium]|uniref:non-specific serine/threonine protein kinase n=4 Tax=Halobacterium salinarum TaxID=2242 RepID=A0A510N5F5_HALSA|nr:MULTISPECIES: RIO1 family regulatory kinase/ATPase [Halobacterium]MBB6090357.1 tRNA A-37 threonylcarbamoyl transferase component Bud32 [Halobacterium salinarum]MCF2165332.1 protein kinase family protein [Halobacterium salinarum]MCF2168832.1 protein kinase family protein [Halobacterium salinarum]MCF2239143.1 protein kinase family protein [Halobacterium salinarum]MDL0120801.1 protein kinase family protein [Halobacterium salinarum]